MSTTKKSYAQLAEAINGGAILLVRGGKIILRIGPIWTTVHTGDVQFNHCKECIGKRIKREISKQPYFINGIHNAHTGYPIAIDESSGKAIATPLF